MHGLSSDTDLRFMIDREVTQIAVGKFQTAIHFDGDVTVTIEGECRVENVRCGPGIEAGRQLLPFLGRVVISAQSIDERHLELRFNDSSTLMILESDEAFESFTITGPSVTIVV